MKTLATEIQSLRRELSSALRFIHKNNIKPAGDFIKGELHPTGIQITCQIDIDVLIGKRLSILKPKYCPFLVAVTDIECYSSHGDFPH